MCEVVGQAMAMAVSRRSLLKGAGAAAAAGAVGGALGPARASAMQATPPSPPSHGDASKYRTRLVLLGVAGGPSVYADAAGISSALVVDGAVYLIDCGHGTPRHFVQAGLGTPTRPGNRAFEGLKGIFLTHLHSDHTVEYPAFQITGMWNGLDDPTKPVQVYGPGDRGGLPPVFGNRPAPPVVEPGDPTPGTVGLTSYLRKAYAKGDLAAMTDIAMPLVEHLAVAGTPDEARDRLRSFEGVADRVILGSAWVGPDPGRLRDSYELLVATFAPADSEHDGDAP